MKTVRAKLNNHGAGILYALLVLLVVAAISSVIITGALVNTSRTENRVEDEQLYLAAESVCDILSNDWHGNLGCAFFKESSVASPSWTMYWALEGGEETDKTVPYANYFQAFAKAALECNDSPFPKTFALSIKPSAEAFADSHGKSNFDGIKVTAKMVSPEYDKTVCSGNGFPDSNFLAVNCIVTAQYTDPAIKVEPYKMLITLSAVPKEMVMDGNSYVYTNWLVTGISQYTD